MNCNSSIASRSLFFMILLGKVKEFNLKNPTHFNSQCIPPNHPHWSNRLPCFYHRGGAGKWVTCLSRIWVYGEQSSWNLSPWPQPPDQCSSHCSLLSPQHELTAKAQNLTQSNYTALSSSCSGTKSSTPNSKTENAKYTSVWSLSKNKFGEGWTKWARSALHRN